MEHSQDGRRRVVIVAGAGGGVGRATARLLARQGSNVVLCDRDERALLESERSLQAAGSFAHDARWVVDIADETSVRKMMAAIEARQWQVEGLANCVGIWDADPVEEVGADRLLRVFQVNVFGMFHLCRAVFPLMKERGGGSIVNVASTAGEYGSITPAAHYAASKGAVIALSKSLAREGAPFSVRVNAVSPGPLNTGMLAIRDEEQRAHVSGRTLLGRIGEAEDVAHAVRYLLSPEASWVTGEVLRVNGGSLL